MKWEDELVEKNMLLEKREVLVLVENTLEASRIGSLGAVTSKGEYSIGIRCRDSGEQKAYYVSRDIWRKLKSQ